MSRISSKNVRELGFQVPEFLESDQETNDRYTTWKISLIHRIKIDQVAQFQNKYKLINDSLFWKIFVQFPKFDWVDVLMASGRYAWEIRGLLH